MIGIDRDQLKTTQSGFQGFGKDKMLKRKEFWGFASLLFAGHFKPGFKLLFCKVWGCLGTLAAGWTPFPASIFVEPAFWTNSPTGPFLLLTTPENSPKPFSLSIAEITKIQSLYCIITRDAHSDADRTANMSRGSFWGWGRVQLGGGARIHLEQ